MVLFGPAGSDDEMSAKKIKSIQIPEYLKNKGLDAFEYPFTRGVNLSKETATLLRDEFQKNNIALSVHAPYFINLGQVDPVKVQNSFSYLLASVERARDLGADRVVFHPASLTSQTREVAFSNTYENTKMLVDLVKENGYDDIFLCPETMGKHGQIGTYEEIAKLCEIDPIIIPTLDFGHINSFTTGGLNSVEKFEEILDLFVNKLGRKEIHIHFSPIEYGAKGELKHLTIETDPGFGPDFKLMIDALRKFDANFRIISESRGMQVSDSIIIKKYYEKGF